MLTQFQSYFTWLIDTLADFLGSEPIIWIVGILLFTLVVKVFLDIFYSFSNF